ncbi:MAG: CRISPR-associated endonuclease Cas6 [Thermoleophilia bacterium]
MLVRTCQVHVRTSPKVEAHGNSLRGYIASRQPQNSLLHNHGSDGRLLYIFPRIQYRVISGDPIIIGLDEGADTVLQVCSELEDLLLVGRHHKVVEQTVCDKKELFGLTSTVTPYQFLTPWLALNSSNFGRYRHCSSATEKRTVLSRILVGNLISISKSLCYEVPGQIVVNNLDVREVACHLKGVSILGFRGTFTTNFEIPNLWGIGKSVGRGFGVVRKNSLIS